MAFSEYMNFVLVDTLYHAYLFGPLYISNKVKKKHYFLCLKNFPSHCVQGYYELRSVQDLKFNFGIQMKLLQLIFSNEFLFNEAVWSDNASIGGTSGN